MKGESKSLGGGFENPTDNWHLFEIDSDIGFSEDKDTKEATNRLTVRLLVIEDETEEGRSAKPGFRLDKPGGRKGLATMIWFSKMSVPIEKKYKLEDGPALSEQDWGNKYLDITSDNKAQRELAQKIVNAFIAKAPGKTFHAETKQKKSSYEKDGQTIPTVYINFPELRFTDDKEIKKKIKDRLAGNPTTPAPVETSSGAPASSTDGGTTDDDDWPDE
jgi:hypothetical protein